MRRAVPAAGCKPGSIFLHGTPAWEGHSSEPQQDVPPSSTAREISPARGHSHSPDTVTLRKNPSVTLLGRNPSFPSPPLPRGSQPRPWWAAEGTPIPLQSCLGGQELLHWTLGRSMQGQGTPECCTSPGEGFLLLLGVPQPSPSQLPFGAAAKGAVLLPPGLGEGHGLAPGGTNRQKTRLGLSSVGLGSSESPGGCGLLWGQP